MIHLTNTVSLRRDLANLFCLLSVNVYVLSFFLPTFAIVVDGEQSISYGCHAFFIGFFSPFASPFFGGLRVFVPWLANPVFWVGVWLFARGRSRFALFGALIATGLCTTLVVFAENLGLILTGYYVWIASMAILAFAAGLQWVGECTSEEEKRTQRYASDK
jgi:hypothetical protein